MESPNRYIRKSGNADQNTRQPRLSPCGTACLTSCRLTPSDFCTSLITSVFILLFYEPCFFRKCSFELVKKGEIVNSPIFRSYLSSIYYFVQEGLDKMLVVVYLHGFTSVGILEMPILFFTQQSLYALMLDLTMTPHKGGGGELAGYQQPNRRTPYVFPHGSHLTIGGTYAAGLTVTAGSGGATGS
jgi:hypothetical protein